MPGAQKQLRLEPEVLRWADKSRALAGSSSAALYQALWKHSQGPLAWTEAKGDSFKLAIFLPQEPLKEARAPLCIIHARERVEASCFQVLPASFKFLRGVVSLDAGADLTDLQATTVLAEMSNVRASWGSETTVACP